MNRSSGLRIELMIKRNWKPWIPKPSFIASDSTNNQLFTEQFAGFGLIIEWNKIFMTILPKQKEMFYWNNVNIRQKCWRLIKAKLLSLSNNADTETEVFHWFKTKQNVKFLYQANVKQQIGYKYQRQLFHTNQYFIVIIFPRGKSCFAKLLYAGNLFNRFDMSLTEG